MLGVVSSSAHAQADDPLTEAHRLRGQCVEFYKAGKYDAGIEACQRALAIYEKALGAEHPDVATTLNNLALLHQAKGDYAKAETLYQRALAIHERALGADHPDVATLLNNLAALYQAKGDYARAEPLYQRAQAIRGSGNISPSPNKPTPTQTSAPPRPSETVPVNQSPQPVLGDEFGTVRTTCEDANARMDAFLISLSDNPRDRGVIVIYDSTERPRTAWYREQLFNNFIKFRRFDPSRIRFIRGPYRSDARVQFWRVPPGASEPEILPANVQAPPAPPERNPPKPYLYATEYSDGLPECQVPMYDVAAYARVLNTEPRSRGRIIIGESSRTRFTRKQREIIEELSGNGVPRNRLTFVYKYVRASRLLETAELWVVPQITKEVATPKPQPPRPN